MQLLYIFILLIILIATFLLRAYRFGLKRIFDIKIYFNKEIYLRVFITLFVFALFSIIVGSLTNYFNKDEVNKEKAAFDAHKKFTIGTITSYKMRGYKAASAYYTYKFDVKNESYYGEFQLLAGSDAFLKRKFLVAYDSTNPQNNYMLVLPKDFQSFNLPFPDSLRWVIQYN